MRSLFLITYVLLWGLVVLEASLIREALRSTIRFKRLYSGSNPQLDLSGPPIGAAAPDFSGPLLGTGDMLRAAQLKGTASLLFFVSPAKVSLPSYQHLTAAIHSMWHRVEGHMYLVCVGNVRSCRKLAPRLQVHGFADNEPPMVLDENAHIAQSFNIDATPAAVELDEDLQVARFGRPIPPAEGLEETEDNDPGHS